MDNNSFSLPSASDFLGAFKEVANTGIDIANSIYGVKNAANAAAFNQQMQSLQLNTAANIAQTQALTAETQAKVALAKAQQPLYDMSNLSGMLQNNYGSGNLMVILAIVGTGIALFSLMRGK